MRRFITVCAVVAAGTALFAQQPAQQNWPSFRGTNAAGTADGKPTAVKWNAPAGENVAWKTPIDGVADAWLDLAWSIGLGTPSYAILSHRTLPVVLPSDTTRHKCFEASVTGSTSPYCPVRIPCFGSLLTDVVL